MSNLYLNSLEKTQLKNKFEMDDMQDIPQEHYDLIMEFEDNMRKIGWFQKSAETLQ